MQIMFSIYVRHSGRDQGYKEYEDRSLLLPILQSNRRETQKEFPLTWLCYDSDSLWKFDKLNSKLESSFLKIFKFKFGLRKLAISNLYSPFSFPFILKFLYEEHVSLLIVILTLSNPPSLCTSLNNLKRFKFRYPSTGRLLIGVPIKENTDISEPCFVFI